MLFLLKTTFQFPIIARLELALRSDVCPFRGDKKKRRVRRSQQNGTEWRQSFQGRWSIQGCLKKGVIDGDYSFFELFIR